MPVEYQTLSLAFLDLMDEIGRYGLEKYGELSMEYRRKQGDFSRIDRTQSAEIASHAAHHFSEYLQGTLHDHFGTKRHQLAAVAFNAMMEYILSEQERD